MRGGEWREIERERGREGGREREGGGREREWGGREREHPRFNLHSTQIYNPKWVLI